MQMKCGALPSVPYTVISKNVVADATRDSEITQAIKYYSHNGGSTGLIFDAKENSSAQFPKNKFWRQIFLLRYWFLPILSIG